MKAIAVGSMRPKAAGRFFFFAKLVLTRPESSGDSAHWTAQRTRTMGQAGKPGKPRPPGSC